MLAAEVAPTKESWEASSASCESESGPRALGGYGRPKNAAFSASGPPCVPPCVSSVPSVPSPRFPKRLTRLRYMVRHMLSIQSAASCPPPGARDAQYARHRDAWSADPSAPRGVTTPNISTSSRSSGPHPPDPPPPRRPHASVVMVCWSRGRTLCDVGP